MFASVVVILGACSSSSSPDAFGDGGASSDGGSSDSANGSDGASDSAISGDATKACADAASAFCTQLQSCSSFGLQVEYGDLATCETRFALGCVQTLQFPGSGATAASTESCATALPAISCTDFIAVNLGNACATQAGTVANGAACGDDAQCASTFCARAADSQCGTCNAVSTAGSACVNGACSTGFACNTDDSTCIVPVSGQIGDTCKTQSQCDVAHAVGCNTNDDKCIALAVASSSTGTCGADSITPTKFTLCLANGNCDSVLNGNCHVTAADGAACNTSNGPNCLSPAKCVSGVCTLPDATACH